MSEIVPSAVVVATNEKPKSATAPKVGKVFEDRPPKTVAKKSAPKRVRKAAKNASKKATNSTAKKRMKRRAFPYSKVLKLWKAGKTIGTIARATGRYQKDADDPLHGFRVSLTRFHKGVKLSGRLVRLPRRISPKTLKLATKAGKKSAA